MNKTAIKNFAIWARVQLIEAAKQRAFEYEITESGDNKANLETVGGRLLSSTEKTQRQQLIEQINQKGYTQAMEEAAYTWFNRFISLRFMEVNGYLPSKVRVFTDENEEFKPEILKQAMTIELEGLDRRKVLELLEKQANEELYKYLLITQCNALNESLPYMFEQIANWTELLFPPNLLRTDSVIGKMVTMIPQEDWTDQVQIIGWLYQYYNTEPKDKVFADLKKNIKITKENIPAATQLFTPDWIVRYMVENSLGRLWLEGHPNDALKSEWKYYLDETEQKPEMQPQLESIRKEYATLKPEEIRVIDPCMGSGHILCALFDTLVQIYENYGYTAREAAVKIVENNLWGLDIDERASQLSYFAVMMKARQYDRRFFSRKVQPHVYAIEESNGITSASLHDMGQNLSLEEYGEAVKQAIRLVEEMHDAKEYGSIIHITPCNWELLRRFAVPRDEDGQLRFDVQGEIEASTRFQMLINVGETLAQKYDVFITNPPYMGTGGMSATLSEYVKKYYFDSKADLFAVFMEKGQTMVNKMGFQAMITQHSWMFLPSFGKMRDKIIDGKNISSLIHLGTRAFDGNDVGTIVQTCSFVLGGTNKGQYLRLVDYGDGDSKKAATEEYVKTKVADYHFSVCTEEFKKIPGHPIAYWVSDRFASIFERENIGKYAISDGQTKTGNNDKYLRNLWEVDSTKVGGKGFKWVKHVKGGSFRKWYGNLDTVIDWSETARNHYKTDHVARITPEYLWFRTGFSWTLISEHFSIRLLPDDCTFNLAAPSLFFSDESMIYPIMGYLNSTIAYKSIKIFNPTFNTNIGDICVQPADYLHMAVNSEITSIVKECIEISREDWDSFETSWDFKEHPFITAVYLAARNGETVSIKQAFENWKGVAGSRFRKLKENEEKLNRIFIDIYGLGEELSPAVEDKDVTVREADLQREIRSFISYAVGCMFGRYTLGKSGLIYAGGVWESSKYTQFQPDKDAIIPICDDEYFEDDIVGRFVRFVEVVYGKETLEENLRFIADALGGKGSSRDVIRNYFINDFYSDHLKVYQKRPIYWLFSSGKKNGFNALVYMHRYQPDLLARMRTDYVHEQQERYRTQYQMLEEAAQTAGPAERVKLNRQITKLKDQSLEIQKYEEKIHHLADQMISIDLDDGVKVNYAKFQDVLEKIK